MAEVNAESKQPTVNPLLDRAIDEQRRRLLDIGKRNPLTNTPLQKQRSNQLRIVDELSDQVFKVLSRDNKAMTFLPRPADDASSGATRVDADTYADYVPPELEAEVHGRHTDTKLQTILNPAELHKRLLRLSREARTLEEEQGVSVLYLALGFIKYFEAEASGVERFAPLLLLPVDLKRDSSRAMFRLAARDDDLEGNKCLTMMCLEDHDLVLPELDVDAGDWSPSQYFQSLNEVIATKPRWEVEPNRMLLSFFSFGRFLMYRDLESEAARSGVVSDLLLGKSTDDRNTDIASISAPYERQRLDELYANPQDLGHILDADTSQTRVIAAAAHGENLVVQGPPGTGKSQTITNMIAVLVRQGKRVLFVAEKRAALDVVKKRLERCGLGPLCLELHSHKANRKFIYDDLRRTFDLGQPTATSGQDYEELIQVRDRLNELSGLVHSVDPTTGNTAYRLMGRLALLIGRGTPIVELDIPGIADWTIEQFDERQAYLQTYAEATLQFGRETEHLWRGVQAHFDVVSQQRLTTELPTVLGRLDDLLSAYERVTEALDVEWMCSIDAVEKLIRSVDLLGRVPDQAKRLLDNDSLRNHWDAAWALCSSLKEHRLFCDALLTKVSKSALEQEWEPHLNAIRQAGTSFLRIFNSRYRRAIGELESVAVETVPKQFDERVDLLEQLTRAIEQRHEIRTNDRLGEALFGMAWKGDATEFDAVLQAIEWVRVQVELLGDNETLKNVLERYAQAAPKVATSEIEQRLDTFSTASNSLFELTRLDPEIGFGTTSTTAIPLMDLKPRLAAWNDGLDKLAGYQELRASGRLLDANDLSVFRDDIGSGRLDPSTAADSLALLRSRLVLDQILASNDQFKDLQQSDRTSLVEQFKSLDAKLQNLAAQELAAQHFENIPRGSSGMVGYVRGELNKKRRHAPIRKLLDSAGDVIVSVKPIFLMSPLSCAQFLSVDGVKFDTLLIDEASQIKPSDALGCIMRARQVIVVGDQKQLPPTSFFDRQVEGSDDDAPSDDELATDDLIAQQSADMESILTLFDARGIKSEMLQWHYRSNHSSLIEVSNVEFYDEKLAFPPSPDSGGANGMQFVHVPNGVYARGRQRNNDIEAETVCEHVIDYLRADPSKTLGVVTLSTAQRDLIQQKIDHYSRESPDVETFCSEAGDEPFFVKNLENVQGDERDAIFVSIGYGKDANGYFAQNFGPVSSEGGERRLNVLFTRARNTCKIFSSIRHDEIRLDAATYDGPRVLKRFLKYAETGDLDIPLSVTEEMDSPFEEDVAEVIEKHGYTVHPQVGTGGFRIDLAVVNPDQPQHYLIAIECDGARYHSSSWARERDRLRQQVLESKGWHFHRIWSTDWFYNREVEISRLIDAIKQREVSARVRDADDLESGTAIKDEASQLQANSQAELATGATKHDDPIERQPQVTEKRTPLSPYREFSGSLDEFEAGMEFLEVPASILHKYIHDIVSLEQPVHVDIVVDRLRNLWGLKRSGARIRTKALDEIGYLVRRGELETTTDGREFLSSPGLAGSMPLRDRSAVETTKLQEPRYVPNVEIRDALTQIVYDSMSIDLESATKEVARLLGAKRRRDEMRELVLAQGSELADDAPIRFVAGAFRRA